MIPFLRTWILNIATVIIFVTLLELLLPNSNMKKYIKMIVGLLVMLVILNPVLELINGKVNIEYEVLKTSAYMDKGTMTANIDRVEEMQDQQMIQLYKEKIERYIKDRIEFSNHVKVINIYSEIEKNKESKDFGNITKLNLVLSNVMEKDTEGIKPVSNILIDISKDKETTYSKKLESKDDRRIDDIKNNISDFLKLDEKKINIHISE